MLTRVAPLALALVAWVAAPVQAQGLRGFELERLELNPGAQGSLLVGTGALLPPGTFRVSLTSHYQRNPLSLYRSDLGLQTLVRDRFTQHLGVGYAPLPWLELGMQVPVVLHQVAFNLNDEALGRPSSYGLSTPQMNARVGLFSERNGNAVDLAFDFALGLPLGTMAVLGRENGFRYTPRVMVGGHLGDLRVGLDAAMLVRPALALSPDVEPRRDEIGNELRAAATVSTTGEGIRWELNLLSALSLTRAPSAVEALAGVRVPVGVGWELYTLGGVGFGSRPGTPLFRVLAGVAFDTGRNPPAQPLLMESEPLPFESPDPVYDPILLAMAPEAPEPDSDLDNVGDSGDECPMEPGLIEEHGCPLKDTDGDGVLDKLDSCVTVKGKPEHWGCPENETPIEITAERLKIDEKIYFDFGKATIKPRSFPLLDKVAKILREHPDIEHIRVEGHTDNISSAEFNLRLSQARSESVRQYLVTKGVEPHRLTARGYGFTRPVDRRNTAAARELNRRVEFIIVSDGEGEDSQPSSTDTTR